MFDSAIFDAPPSQGGSSVATTYAITGLQSTVVVGVTYILTVVFDALLTTGTTVTVTDGTRTMTVTVGVGANFGSIAYIPAVLGSKTLSATHSGQSGISDPASLSTSAIVVNPNNTNTAATTDPQSFLSHLSNKDSGRKFDGYTNTLVQF